MNYEFKWHRWTFVDNTIALYRNDDRMVGNLEELHLLRGGDGDRIACVVGVMSGHPTVPFS
jgi:hypothetical protein